MNLQELFTEYQLLKQAYENTYRKLHSISNISAINPFSNKLDNEEYYQRKKESRNFTEKHLFEISDKLQEINTQLREHMSKKYNIYLENL